VTREQLAHILRAASQIAEVSDVIVIGSQSVLGTFDDAVLPDEVIGSIEVDVAFLNDPANEKSDKVEGAIGEFSPLHEMFQYYAEGMSTSTAIDDGTVIPAQTSSAPSSTSTSGPPDHRSRRGFDMRVSRQHNAGWTIR
jgi:hypothetical protein